MNNFVNQPPTQSKQNFLELLNSSTGGDGKINKLSDVFYLLLCKSENIALGITYICTMSAHISERCSEKYAANLQENTYAKVWFQLNLDTLCPGCSMYICCIFSEYPFIRKPVGSACDICFR